MHTTDTQRASSSAPAKIKITREWERAFQQISQGEPFVFITGRAGSGKSTFLALLRSRLRNVAVVAPTGVAALNVNGQTIHSFFRIAPGPIDFDQLARARPSKTWNALQTLIIDEISMVRADLLDAIDFLLRKFGMHPSLPFGGVQVVGVGDLYQLPPIVARESEQSYFQQEYSSPLFFGARVFRELEIHSVEFSEIFRQRDDRFIDALNGVREGVDVEQHLEVINSRVERLSPTFSGIVLCGTNAVAARINQVRMDALPGTAVRYVGVIRGEFDGRDERLPVPVELTLKPGARVMFVRNDDERRWVNGTIGTVVELLPKAVVVQGEENGNAFEIAVGVESWENFRYQYNAAKRQVVAEVIGSYEQIPLVPAWAVTVHKSQGKSFDRVHIDLGGRAFAEGQVYVALSRCRTLEGVTLERPISGRDIRVNEAVRSFFAKGEGGGLVSEESVT